MRIKTVLFALLVFAMAVSPARADGLIVPMPPGGKPLPLDTLSILHHRVSVSIQDRLATTRVDQSFLNESGIELEGEYLFPVPLGAAVSSLEIIRDGVRTSGKVLESDKALERYREIVSQLQDPALLEYAGRGAYRARIYPITARGEVEVDIAYSEVLRTEGGWLLYHYPLTPERFSREPIADLRVEIEIEQHQGIGAIYCPSHDVAVERVDERRATVTYAASDVWPDRDLVLYVGQADSELQANLLSYRQPGEDGFFALSIRPNGLGAAGRAPSDYVVLLDTSGSMRGAKLEQAQEGVCRLISELGDSDRLRVVAFASDVRPLGGWWSADDALTAERAVRATKANGGTDIAGALDSGLSTAESERPQTVILVTDGLPTVGETRTAEILSEVRAQSDALRRIFCFGVGYDVDTILLDTLAQENGGACSYIRPGDRLDLAVAAFAAKVTSPSLSDIAVTIEGTRVSQIVPWRLPDLYAGEELMLIGRYTAAGDVTVSVKGSVGGESVKRTYGDLRLRKSGGAEFLPRLWATRQVGERLTRLRLYGPDGETIDEIVSLAVRYGIVTPYTSYLADEGVDVLDGKAQEAIAARELAAAERAYAVGSQARGVGKPAVAASMDHGAMAGAERAEALSEDKVRQVGAKTFVLDGTEWVDTAYDPVACELIPVSWYSDRFFEVLALCDEMPVWLALGRNIIVVWDGQAYRIGDGLGDDSARSDDASGAFVSEWFLAWALDRE